MKIKSGLGVSHGEAIGRVKTVSGSSDFHKIEEGDVLVAKMTDPTMTIIMGKAGAIVTDFGGLSSHAAIVARELGIPCVSAVKDATATLQDGMLVKVDGTKGEVTIIEDSGMNDKEIDKLLDILCEGIYAMDPKTALPFWDYDFGPLFGDQWIDRMLVSIKKINGLIDAGKLSYKQVAECFPGIALPRKELIYSLSDLKVGSINKEDRKLFIDFWWKIIKEKIQNKDYLCENMTNLIHTEEEIEQVMCECGEVTGQMSKEIGRMAMALNQIAYGLYSDIFAHYCFENFGPYDVSKYLDGTSHILVVKTWKNLKPIAIWPTTKDFKFNDIKILCIYKDMDYEIDIYNHQTYSSNTLKHLVKAAVFIDGEKVKDLSLLKEISEYLSKFAVEQYNEYKACSFEKLKQLWIMQRSYGFKEFFRIAGIEWNGREMQQMLEQVKGKETLKDPFWNFEHQKERLFLFWKQCFDPRIDTYYHQWQQMFDSIVISVQSQ